MRKAILFVFGAIIVFAILAVEAASKPAVNARANDPMPIVQSETDKYWLKAMEIAYKTVPDLLVQHQAEYKRGLTHAKLMHGDQSIRRIAITFDDGPHPDYTPEILAILAQYKVKATFFVVGEMAEKYPNLVKAEAAAGHSIGNHTYHHVNLTKIPEAYVATEISACDEVLKKILGRRTHLIRPPGGDYTDKVAEVAEALGYTTVLWTDDPGDYTSPGENVIRKRIMDKIGDGGIILIHDGIKQTINVLPRLIKELTDQGYQFETIEEMLHNK